MNEKVSLNKRRSTSAKETSRAKVQRESEASQTWTFTDRCRLVEAMSDTKINKFPVLVRKYVGTKNKSDVVNYMNFLLDPGKVYPEFEHNAVPDVWLTLMEKTQRKDDTNAEQCIPQIVTVAALEKTDDIADNQNSSPNYANVYNYLAMLLKGNEPADLPPIDAKVVLYLLDDLMGKFSNSHSLLQKEFLDEAFGVLNENTSSVKNMAASNGVEVQEHVQSTLNAKEMPRMFPSLNPLNVPSALLEFKKKTSIVLDFSTSNWRTTLS